MPPHRCSCPICATRTTKRVVSKPLGCLWAPTLTIFWAYETHSLYMPMSLYTYIYIYIYYDIYRYMCVCVNIYITPSHIRSNLKKKIKNQGTHGILPAQTQATPKLCEERRSRSQASTVATNHGWIKWIGLFRGVIPGVPNEPLRFYRGTNGTSGTMAWFFGHFAKAVGLIAGDKKKNLFHDFSSACRLVLCPNTNTKNPLLPDPRSRKKLYMAKKVSSHEKMLLKATYIHHIDMPTSYQATI